MLRLCKILIHDSSHRFLYPILSKRSKGALHPFWHWEQTSTVLTLQWKMQFVPGFLHWPSLIVYRPRIPGNTKYEAKCYATNRNRKSENQFRIDYYLRWKFSFFIMYAVDTEYPFSSTSYTGLSLQVFLHYIHGYQSRKKLELSS